MKTPDVLAITSSQTAICDPARQQSSVHNLKHLFKCSLRSPPQAMAMQIGQPPHPFTLRRCKLQFRPQPVAMYLGQPPRLSTQGRCNFQFRLQAVAMYLGQPPQVSTKGITEN